MKSQRVKTCLKVSGKIKDVKEKPDSFVLIERLRTNCHAIKIKINRTTSCSNLAAKARETAKRAASCAFVVNLEQAMVPLKLASKMVLKIICMMLVEFD